ncbi:hypothetical protein HG535_0E01680 [Zygotorulaspora mrakii]|uniref:Uncharacterized protein n=1 Tax=Zygotorulaspora mrakii TaxID=42260 RepID=A0A7H9B3U5_ZYGMR|nr:uncharacterized protein HG535_0E01680 [Zygotorulaspora mrakii]QLG73084.1 hypothetical protein HG535_0E01680 [Zygotorulaspora mrakii]
MHALNAQTIPVFTNSRASVSLPCGIDHTNRRTLPAQRNCLSRMLLPTLRRPPAQNPLPAPFQPPSSPLPAPFQPPSSPLPAPFQPPSSPLPAPFQPPSSPLPAPFQPLRSSTTRKTSVCTHVDSAARLGLDSHPGGSFGEQPKAKVAVFVWGPPGHATCRRVSGSAPAL